MILLMAKMILMDAMTSPDVILVQEILNGIGGLGFPIVVCVCLWKYINTTMKEFTKTMQENTELLKILQERLKGDKEHD